MPGLSQADGVFDATLALRGRWRRKRRPPPPRCRRPSSGGSTATPAGAVSRAAMAVVLLLGLGFGIAACKSPPTTAQVNADVAAGIGVLQGAATAYIDGEKCKADLPVIKGLTLQTALAVASDPACVAALNAAAGAGNAADAIVQAN